MSGMVKTHKDPWGYEHEKDLVEDRRDLAITGDYLATAMAYLKTTEAGGNTAFTEKNYEGTLEPTKGSLAFWINLTTCHRIDRSFFQCA